MIAGLSLLERVWRLARAVRDVDTVLVATDDAGIARHAEAFGATAVMTPALHQWQRARLRRRCGADASPRHCREPAGRCRLDAAWIIQAVVEHARDPDVALAPRNTSGCAASLPPWCKPRLQERRVAPQLCATCRVMPSISPSKYCHTARDQDGPIPAVFHHIGLYAYRYATLQTYVELPPTPLETAEKLEQLRALEHGIPIRVVPVDFRGHSHWSVDTPEDVNIVEDIIRREGELL